MKISIIHKFVVSALGALLAVNLVGCGGGTVPAAPLFPSGIYVATGNNKVKYTLDTSLTGAQDITLNVGGSSSAVAFDHNGRLYCGSNGVLEMIPKLGSATQTTLTGVAGDSITSVHAIAFDSQNRIYFADFTKNRIVRINNMTGAGWKVLDLSSIATGQVDFGTTVALDSQDRIYITHRSQGKILRYNNMDDANPVSFVPTGPSTGSFNDPVFLCIDKADHIYVADRNNGRIVRFDDMTGAGWQSFGMQGTGINQFFEPSGISVDETGHIYVIDKVNDRLVKIDDMTGSGWTTWGNGFSVYNDKRSICVH